MNVYLEYSSLEMRNVNSDVAYEHIRKRILSGVYSPGYPLMTEKLSAEIGVSRTPVREALHRLSADGLIVIRPQMGASVKRLDPRDLREMCQLRLALEGYSAALAATNHDKSELRDMEFAFKDMAVLTERFIAAGPDEEQAILDEHTGADARFHVTIITAGNNRLMKKEILRLHLVNRVLATSGGQPGEPTKAEKNVRRREVQEQHREILEAISRRDAIEARTAMERHLQEIIDMSFPSVAQLEPEPISRGLTPEEVIYSA